MSRFWFAIPPDKLLGTRLNIFGLFMAIETDIDQSMGAALLESGAISIVVLDAERRVINVSPAFERLVGRAAGEIRGRPFAEMLSASGSPDQVETQFDSTIGESGGRIRARMVSGDGSNSEFLWSLTRLNNTNGAGAWAAIGVDITEIARVEAAVEESLARYESILASAMDAIITIGPDQCVTMFNAAAEKMFLCKAEAAVGRPIGQFIPDQFRGAHKHHVRTFGQTNVTARSMGSLGAIAGLRSNGEEFPLEASISQSGSGDNKLYTVILRDISLRVQSEERLREQAALLNHAQEAILVRDLDHRVLFWNKGAERLYGWKSEEVIGKAIGDLLYQGDATRFEEAFKTVLEHGEFTGEMIQYSRDGKKVFVEGRWTLVRDHQGKAKSVLVINTDVTERKKLEAQFLRAQRMESIGTLAGGIAHDLNNILSPIIMAMNLLRLRFKDEESQRVLSVLQSNAERGADMVKQVLSFARGIEGERISLHPKHLIRDIVKILKDTLPKSIDIRFFIPETAWPVLGDATQLHQVLMNLCVNARDAMPAGGEIKIEAANVSIDENYAQMQIDARPGKFVLITVADSGAGIPHDIINSIFDPFFTTKEFGKGTGLGLSTVLGIVKSHGGFVNVYSETGRGAQFKVYLPADSSFTSAHEEAAPEQVRFGNGQLILVVDDEASIREITRGTLEAYGYKVLVAGDGAEAVALYAQNRDEIRAVLTDMMMPYLDGPATIRALQKMNSGVRIIAASGLADNEKLMEASRAGVHSFLAKPFTADALLKRIAETLDQE